MKKNPSIREGVNQLTKLYMIIMLTFSDLEYIWISRWLCMEAT